MVLIFPAALMVILLRLSSADDQRDPGYDLLSTSVTDPIPRTCLDSPNLPSYLHGKYIVSGPAKFELGEYKFQGLFDGFGRVNRFELGDRKVCFTADWLNTTTLSVSEERGSPAGMLFEETVPPRPMCPLQHPLCNMKQPADNDWVNVIQVGGQTLMLTDSFAMLQMDMDSLGTTGLKKWADDSPSPIGPPHPGFVENGHVATSGSAHPVQRPGTNTWVDVVSVMGPLPLEHSFLDVYTFQADTAEPQNRTRIASIKLDNTPYLHSFGVTPNYVVLPINHKMGTPNFERPLLLGKIQEHWAGVHIIDNSGKVRIFAADFETFDKLFYHVHIVNAFDNDTGVTLDVGAYQSTPFAKSAQIDIALMRDKKARDSNPTKNVVRRLHFHLSGPLQGQTTVQDFKQIAGSSSDFFRVSPAHVGLPYCFYYATQWWHNGVDAASMAIIKHNVCQDTSQYWSLQNTYLGEPFFVPSNSGEEDDGVVIFVALDGPNRRSVFVILDGKTMVALDVVKLPGRIPFTAHGNFFSDASVDGAASFVV